MGWEDRWNQRSFIEDKLDLTGEIVYKKNRFRLDNIFVFLMFIFPKNFIVGYRSKLKKKPREKRYWVEKMYP